MFATRMETIMCTVISYRTKDHYFGRNLDVEYSYGEKILVTPRTYPFPFRSVRPLPEHYAMIGVGIVVEGYPLYFDATNEKGLSMAGLLFPKLAVYQALKEDCDNVASFELIPWILGQCETVEEVRVLLSKMNVLNLDYNSSYKAEALHWMISDREESITIEAVEDGLRIFDNEIGVMTNSPGFDIQMFALNNYMRLTTKTPENTFSDKLQLEPYSRGMGAMGLPGDLSSMSRFARVAFTKLNSVCGDSEEESLSQFFHILACVEQQQGCVCLGGGNFEKTVYSSCCNTDKGIYYYRTYDTSRICAVNLFHENLDGQEIREFSMDNGAQIYWQN